MRQVTRWTWLADRLRRFACKIDMHRHVNAYGWCMTCETEVGQHNSSERV